MTQWDRSKGVVASATFLAILGVQVAGCMPPASSPDASINQPDAVATDVSQPDAVAIDASTSESGAADADADAGSSADVPMPPADGAIVRDPATCSPNVVMIGAAETRRINADTCCPSYSEGQRPAGWDCIAPAVIPHLGSAKSVRFVLAARSQVTMWPGYSSQNNTGVAALATDCAAGLQSCIGLARYAGPGRRVTSVFEPGGYEANYLTTGPAWLVVEPPVPPPSNTTCEHSITYVSDANAIGPRVVDEQSRFVRFVSDVPTPWRMIVMIPDSSSNVDTDPDASAEVVVRNGCGASATVVAEGSLPRLIRGLEFLRFVANPGVAYFLEFRRITVGAMFNVAIQGTLTGM